MLEEIVYTHRDKVTRILFLEIRVVEHSLEKVVCPDTLYLIAIYLIGRSSWLKLIRINLSGQQPLPENQAYLNVDDAQKIPT